MSGDTYNDLVAEEFAPSSGGTVAAQRKRKGFNDVLRQAYEAGYTDADNGGDNDFEAWRETL